MNANEREYAANGLMLRHNEEFGLSRIVAFRSAKERGFRGAKGDNLRPLVV